jgi:hypothetical protein
MKKTKVIEIRHKVAPTPAVVNPLQSQINDLKEAVATSEAMRQLGYVEQSRRIEALRVRLEHETGELWSVLRDGEWITRLKV